jgi:hypothetical protein
VVEPADDVVDAAGPAAADVVEGADVELVDD